MSIVITCNEVCNYLLVFMNFKAKENSFFYFNFRPSLSTTLTLKYRDSDGSSLNKYDRITKFPGITVCGLTPFKGQGTRNFFIRVVYSYNILKFMSKLPFQNPVIMR